MSESSEVAITTVTSILIITNIVGNSLVCAVVMRNRDMRIPVNYLLLNLALADIIYSTFLIPVLIVNHIPSHPDKVPGIVVCLLRNGALAWVGAYSSLFILVAIATERYYAVIHPFGGKLNKRKLKVIILSSWIFGCILYTPDFLRVKFVKEINPNYCIYEWPKKWMSEAYTVTRNAIIFLFFLLMFGLYSRVVYTLWFKRSDDNRITHQQQGVLKVRKRVTLMVLSVSVIFAVCWGTHLILHLLEDFGSYKLSSFAIPIAHTMVLFNSAFNPFAYALINQRFREKMKGMICCNSSPFRERESVYIEMNNR